MSAKTANHEDEIKAVYSKKDLAVSAVAALVIGLFIGWWLTPSSNRDEVTRLQGQVATLKVEADKVPSLEKKLSEASASIKQARAEGVDFGMNSCPSSAPIATAPTTSTTSCVATVPARPARKVVSAPRPRQYVDSPAPVARQPQVVSIVKHTCTAFDRATGKGEDFLDPSRNYRGIKVTTGPECKAAREQYKRDHPKSFVVSDDA